MLALWHQKAGTIVPFCLAMQAPPGSDSQHSQLAIGQWDLLVRITSGFEMAACMSQTPLSQTSLQAKHVNAMPRMAMRSTTACLWQMLAAAPSPTSLCQFMAALHCGYISHAKNEHALQATLALLHFLQRAPAP